MAKKKGSKGLYANIAAKGFSEIFRSHVETDKPILIIEPGSALVGDAMSFFSKVYSIKKIRNKFV